LSDGSASVAEMAAASVDLDYEHIAIPDHAKIAGGIGEAQLYLIELNLNPAGNYVS
jgi:hypothetical protein